MAGQRGADVKVWADWVEERLYPEGVVRRAHSTWVGHLIGALISTF